MQNLQPVVGPQYCAPYVVEFTVVKLAFSLSGGDFDIKDSNGNIFFRVDGRFLSIRDTRVLLDSQGNALLCARRKILTLRDAWSVYRGDGSYVSEANRLFTLKRSSLFQIRTSLDVFLASNTRKNVPDFKVKGKYFRRSYTVFRGNETVAEVRRKYTGASIFLGKDTFVVTIFPGMDYAFIAILIVLLDEIHRAQRKPNNSS